MMPAIPVVAACVFAGSALLLLPACTQRASIQFMTMPAGADADLLVTADQPPLPRASVEVRNVGDTLADITVAEAEYWGASPAATITGPTLPLPPGGTWQATIDQGALLRLSNRGPTSAELQLFTPGWTTLSLVLYPRGRDQPPRTVIISQPGADGVFRQPPVRPAAQGPQAR